VRLRDIDYDMGATTMIIETESIAYLILVTAVCFAAILALYLLHIKTIHNNENKSKTKAEQ